MENDNPSRTTDRKGAISVIRMDLTLRSASQWAEREGDSIYSKRDFAPLLQFFDWRKSKRVGSAFNPQVNRIFQMGEFNFDNHARAFRF